MTTLQQFTTLRAAKLAPGDEFMIPQGMTFAGRWLVVLKTAGGQICARRPRRGAVVACFRPDQTISDYTYTKQEGQMPPAAPTKETSQALEALDTIREALDDEIDVSVDTDLTNAFQCVKEALSGESPNGLAALSTDQRGEISKKFSATAIMFDKLAGHVDEEALDLIAQDLKTIAELQVDTATLLVGGSTEITLDPEGKPLTFSVPTAAATPEAASINLGATPKVGLPEGFGEKIGINDATGKALRVGDRIRFTGSNRYGSGEATVIGVGDTDNEGDDNMYRRPKLKLDGNRDPYEPTARRVVRIGKADKATGEVVVKSAERTPDEAGDDPTSPFED